jgi:hypothetical protein
VALSLMPDVRSNAFSLNWAKNRSGLVRSICAQHHACEGGPGRPLVNGERAQSPEGRPGRRGAHFEYKSESAACKAVYAGSIPTPTSNQDQTPSRFSAILARVEYSEHEDVVIGQLITNFVVADEETAHLAR